MANIDPAPSWANIRRLETTDRNMAGPGGILNDPTTSIAARLNLLRDNDTALGSSLAAVNARQDATDSAIANIEGQVLNAPGTLSDLENGAAIDPAAGFPDVPSVENSLGPVDAINSPIEALAARSNQLKNWRDDLVSSVENLGLRIKDLTLEQFGAVSGGIIDCRQAFLDADAAAPLGSRLVLSPGSIYRVSAAPTLKNISYIEGNGATIKMIADDLGAGAIALVMRNLLATITISVSEPIVVAGGTDRVPKTSQLSGVQVGDMLCLRSSQARTWLNSGSNTAYYDGQYAVVSEVRDAELVVTTGFYGSFPVSSIDHYRPAKSMAVRNLDFDLSQTKSTATTVIGLDIRGINMLVENFRLNGNDYVAIGLQMQGEGGVVINPFIDGALNGLGNGSARLGYGINLGGNNLRVYNITAHNVKHAVTNAVRSVVSRGLGVYGGSVKQYRRDASFDTFLAAVDTHANTLDIFEVIGVNIDTEGHACLFRNGKLRMVGCSITLRGAYNSEVVRDNELPCSYLDFSDNDVTLSADSHIVFDPAASQQPSNARFTRNNIRGPGHFIRTRNQMVYDANGIQLVDNYIDGLRSIFNITLGAGSMRGLLSSGTYGQMAASSQFAMRLMTDTTGTGTYVDTKICDGSVLSWAANSLANVEGVHLRGTFVGLLIDSIKLRIQNGVNYTARGIWFDRCNLSRARINGVDVDSEIISDGDTVAPGGTGISTMHDDVLYTSNSVEAIRFNEAANGAGFVMKRVKVDGNPITNTRGASCVSIGFASGTTSLADSDDIPVTNNVLSTTAANCISAIVPSGTAYSKLSVQCNHMSGAYAESTARYRIPPLGNVSPNPLAFRGGTTIRPDGRVTASSAPASGTWAVGDRVFNSVPAVGQPKSWVCTVAGAPGTWVSEGTL